MPNLFIPVVDVRDVASAHLLAMTSPQAAGERFLLSNGPALSLCEIARTVRAAVGEAARRVPTRTMPDLMLRAAALFRPELRPFVPDLGYARRTSNEKAMRQLGWMPRDPHDAIGAAARSMAEVPARNL